MGQRNHFYTAGCSVLKQITAFSAQSSLRIEVERILTWGRRWFMEGDLGAAAGRSGTYFVARTYIDSPLEIASCEAASNYRPPAHEGVSDLTKRWE